MPRLTLSELEALLDQHAPRWRSHCRMLALGEHAITVAMQPTEHVMRAGAVASSPLMALADRAAYYLTLALAGPVPSAVTVLGADLGIPVVANDKLFIMFGDTIGFAGIWQPGESHPDSVGYGIDSATAIAAQPALLCNRLGIVALPPADSVGPGVNSSIAADFAGVAMIAPAGHSLAEYIHNPSAVLTGS
jgi:hypothetical protein